MKRKYRCAILIVFSTYAVLASGATTDPNPEKRDLDIAWPISLDPEHADVFDHNRLLIEAACGKVYRHLANPFSWPEWLVFAKDVRATEPSRTLRVGSRFRWKVFGTPIESTVFVAETGRRFGYTNTPPGPPPRYAQSWSLLPKGRSCLVTTEEIGFGPDAQAATKAGDIRVHIAHDLWLASLRWIAVSKP